MLAEVCECGETLYPKPDGTGKEWFHVTAAGQAFADRAPAALREDPVKWWADLAANDIGTYSSLKVATDLNALYWWHPHRPVSRRGRDPRVGDREPPFCCKMPMRMTPSGWQCRRSGQMFDFTSPLVLPEVPR